MHLFGLWEEAEAPRENSCRHNGNMQTQKENSCYEETVLTTTPTHRLRFYQQLTKSVFGLSGLIQKCGR